MTPKILNCLHPCTCSMADISPGRLVSMWLTYKMETTDTGLIMNKWQEFSLTFWNISGVDGGRNTKFLCMCFTRPQGATCCVLNQWCCTEPQKWTTHSLEMHAVIEKLSKGGWSNLFSGNENKQWQNEQADCQTLSLRSDRWLHYLYTEQSNRSAE